MINAISRPNISIPTFEFSIDKYEIFQIINMYFGYTFINEHKVTLFL